MYELPVSLQCFTIREQLCFLSLTAFNHFSLSGVFSSLIREMK